MKAKFFIAGLLLAGAVISSSAQSYKDGIEYYKVDQLDNAKELLERNLNAPSTNKSEAFYYLGQIVASVPTLTTPTTMWDKLLSNLRRAETPRDSSTKCAR